MDMNSWAQLMGHDLEQAVLQPLQPVRLGRDCTIRLHNPALRALGFSGEDCLLAEMRDGVCALCRATSGGHALEKGKLPVSQAVAKALSPPDASGAVLVGRKGEAAIVPLYIQEHAPDVLGPRFVDEWHGDRVVRHAVPGLSRDAWTSDALCGLEDLLCDGPFPVDPVPILAKGYDWVAWMTRNHIIGRPGSGDDRLQADLAGAIYCEQQTDGSWRTVVDTGYAILQLLALGESPSGERVQRAGRWLLAGAEPPPHPGMWMLTDAYLQAWMAVREPSAQRAFAPGETQWAHPGRCSFYTFDTLPHEQAAFGDQEPQQVIPSCNRFAVPACEPRLTHISALVAEALLRCGYADHPRLRRYINTIFHLGGEWGYWCGCGALGLDDADILPDEHPPNLNVRREARDGPADLSPWRWIDRVSRCTQLFATATRSTAKLDKRGTHVDPFRWHRIPGQDRSYALLGTAWQNADCWMKVNRALARYPSCPGSLTEALAIYQASRYQTSLGEWNQAYPSGMLAFLALYGDSAAKSLAIKTVPWLREHQADDGLWHVQGLVSSEEAVSPEPRLATYHILAALHQFGLLERLRGQV